MLSDTRLGQLYILGLPSEQDYRSCKIPEAGLQQKSWVAKLSLSGKISGCILLQSDTPFVSTIRFSNLLVIKVRDTANLTQSSFEGISAQWLQVFKSCFCLFRFMWQICHFLASGIHTSATLPKANTSKSVTLNMHDKTLTFCQKSVTPMRKVALSIHVGCCASLTLSFLTMISDTSHTSGRQSEKSLSGEKYFRNFVVIAL